MHKKLILFFLFCFLTPSIVCSAEKNIIGDANNRFAFELYREFKDEGGNIFLSPYSALSALAMACEGARGDTLRQMASVLHLPQNTIFLRVSFLETHKRLNKNDGSFILSTANALWANKGYPFNESYFELVREYYGGKAETLDFENDASGSCRAINSWVGDNTAGKIKDIVSEDSVDSSTRMILTNAVYFKGKWDREFDEGETKKMDFKAGAGNNVSVDMMSLSGQKFNYAEKPGLQVLELPYKGGRLSMFVFLPAEGGMASFEGSLDDPEFRQIKGMLKREEVAVLVPRFKFLSKYSLGPALTDLGMPDAFLPSKADFSGMTGKKDLFIQSVLHQAFIEVNEEGTEAAAATAVSFAITATQDEGPVTFYADHPFVFLIYDNETATILFLGRVNDPGQG